MGWLGAPPRQIFKWPRKNIVLQCKLNANHKHNVTMSGNPRKYNVETFNLQSKHLKGHGHGQYQYFLVSVRFLREIWQNTLRISFCSLPIFANNGAYSQLGTSVPKCPQCLQTNMVYWLQVPSLHEGRVEW